MPTTASNNEPRTGISFFDLPAEIRQIIYDYTASHDSGWVWLHDTYHRRMIEQDPVYRNATVRTYLWAYQTSENLCLPLRPSINALAATCRRCDLEADSPRFYRENSFIAHSINTLVAFVNDTRPRHLQVIRELEIVHFGLPNPPHIPFTNLVGPRSVLPYSKWNTIQPRNMKLLKSFQNLRLLTLFDETPLAHGPRPGGEHPSTRRMNGLVRASWTFENLQTIKVHRCVEGSMYGLFRDFKMDPDDIPGWTYSYESKAETIQSSHVSVTETLEKVHRPLWPKTRRLSRVDPLENGSFEESMRLFGAGIEQGLRTDASCHATSRDWISLFTDFH